MSIPRSLPQTDSETFDSIQEEDADEGTEDDEEEIDIKEETIKNRQS